MTDVTIEYCVPCGHIDRAVQTQRALLEEFGRSLDGVRLQPGQGGVFSVEADGDLLWDIDDQESGFDQEAITAAVRERVHATG